MEDARMVEVHERNDTHEFYYRPDDTTEAPPEPSPGEDQAEDQQDR